MRVGVDGVLVGAWACRPGAAAPGRVLDVGTGCGLIALICAQRYPDARISAIDIHPDSVEEAAGNFGRSPWADRLEVKTLDFAELANPDSSDLSESSDCSDSSENLPFDLIVSNPPFFDSGIDNPDSPRLTARHQSGLTLRDILRISATQLSPQGRLVMIFPAEFAADLAAYAECVGMSMSDFCEVRGHASAPVKRVIAEFTPRPSSLAPSFSSLVPRPSSLTLESSPGVPTPDYRSLCGDLYLKF